MNVDNELVEVVTAGKQEYEEILVQEEVLEPLTTDSAATASTQGKPRCITLIFYNH